MLTFWGRAAVPACQRKGGVARKGGTKGVVTLYAGTYCSYARIAKHLDFKQQWTTSCKVLGSSTYMSPTEEKE